MSEPTVETVRNPYPGLRPFRSDEKHLFFGREQQVDRMVEKLAAHHFLAVVGGSGSGKSSLVNCGLRPALHRGNMASAGAAWRMAQMRPGNDPIGALARALAAPGVLFDKPMTGALSGEALVESTLRLGSLGLIDMVEQADLPSGTQVLVVADQFEELFRFRSLVRDASRDGFGAAEDGVAFVQLLLEAAAQTTVPIYVVLTMRSDFLGDCDQFHGLPEAMNEGQYLVPRLTRDEIRAAITCPAAVRGATLSPVLVTRLLNDVGDNPDQLSILQHALNRTWARWENEGGSKGPLDLPHYEAIGTMAHALDQHAERAYAEPATPRQQKICEKLFKALTDKATDPRGVRRPTTLGTLCSLADATATEVTEVIDVFRKPSRSFLMPPTGEALTAERIIDISHESLMRVWQRLNTWADEEAQSAQTYRRLADTAALHAAGKASLWRDPDLQLALDWRDQSQPNKTWASRYGSGFDDASAFLRDSEAARAAELEKERQQAEAERIAKERELEQAKALARSRLVTRAAVVCGAFTVFALYMWWNALTAAKDATDARDQARTAETAALKAEKEAKGLREVAEKKAKEEQGLRETADGAKAKATAAATEAAKQAHLALGGKVAAQSVLFADPSVNVPLDTAALLAIASYQLQPSFEARRGLLMPLSRLAQVRKVLASPTAPNGVAFSPDGKTIVSAGDNGMLIQWDVETGRLLRQLVGGHHDARAWAVTFSPDGAMIVSADDIGAVTFWDAASGKLLSGPEKNHERWINNVLFNRAGTTLVSASDDGTLVFWNPATKKPDGGPLPTGSGVNAVAFSPDGKRLVTAQNTGALVLWDPSDRQKVDDLETIETGGAFAVAFSPKGEQMVSGYADGTVAFWRRDGDGKFRVAAKERGHRDWVWSLDFSSDGRNVVSASKDGTIVVWNPDQYKPVGEVLRAHKNEVRSVAFSPDGKTFVSASYDNSLILWDVDAPITIGHSVHAHTGVLRSLAFRPDGKTIVSGGQDGLKIWDAATRKQLKTEATGAKKDDVLSVAFSPDGRLIASGRRSGALELLDGATLTSVVREVPFAHKDGTLTVAFSSHEKILVSGGEDNKLRSWNSGTLQPRPSDPASGHDRRVRTIAISPDGKSVASAGDDLIVKFWAVPGLKRVAETPRKHDRDVNAVAYDPSGRILASASNDGTVLLWDVGARRPLGEPLRGHRIAARSDGVTSLSFSRDGRVLASGATDATIILWDVETRLPLEPLRGHKYEVLAVAFSPDGRTLVSGDKNGDMFFWDVDPQLWQGKLCAKLTRNLSQSEWDTYVGKNYPYQKQCPPKLPKSSN
jgi:WD40 repeat protein/energy-coupling factor transporter ATP-binding protein EcfA2